MKEIKESANYLEVTVRTRTSRFEGEKESSLNYILYSIFILKELYVYLIYF